MDGSEFLNHLWSFMIPLAGIFMPVFIVAIIFWHKSREKELQAHMELRQREMEHAQKMKQLELEIEKAKAAQSREPAGKIGS